MEASHSLLQCVPVHPKQRARKGARHYAGCVLDAHLGRPHLAVLRNQPGYDDWSIIIGDRWAAARQWDNAGKKDTAIAGGSFGRKSRRQARISLRPKKNSRLRAHRRDQNREEKAPPPLFQQTQLSLENP